MNWKNTHFVEMVYILVQWHQHNYTDHHSWWKRWSDCQRNWHVPFEQKNTLSSKDTVSSKRFETFIKYIFCDLLYFSFQIFVEIKNLFPINLFYHLIEYLILELFLRETTFQHELFMNVLKYFPFTTICCYVCVMCIALTIFIHCIIKSIHTHTEVRF